MAAYNLIDEPWIDAVMPDGRVQPISLKKALFDAPVISDIKTQSFHGIRFALYDYLVIRLLAGIVADALPLDEDVLRRMLFDGGYGELKGVLEEYLDRCHERFNLFGTRPFLQASDYDLELWKKRGVKINPTSGDYLKGNPLAPAESARLMEYSSIMPEEFLAALGEDAGNPLLSAIPPNVKPSDLQDALSACYRITPKEYAYILLYHGCATTGAGAGAVAAIAGNAYYAETVEGSNLFETILYNAAALAGDRKAGIPQWRWESQLYGYARIGVEPLTGLFFPTRVITASLQDGFVSDLVVAVPRFGAESNKIVSQIRNYWALENEPHFVHMDPAAYNEKIMNPYAKLDDHEPLWLLLLQSTQTLPHVLPDSGAKKKEKPPRFPLGVCSLNLSELARMDLLPENARIRITYRLATPKWVYLACSTTEASFSSRIAVSLLKQKAVLRLAGIARASIRQTDYYARVYLRPNPFKPESDRENNLFVGDVPLVGQVSDRLRDMIFSPGGFLDRIAQSADDGLDEIVSAFAEVAATDAVEAFAGLYNPNRISLFYSCSDRLGRSIRNNLEGGNVT